MDTPGYRRVYRIRRLNNESLPSWYAWKLHLFVNAFLLSFSLVYSLTQVQSFNLLFFISSFVVWAVIEYFIHRFVLHGRLFSKLLFYKQHTFFHHGYFTHLFMEVKDGIDVNRVLLFPVDIAAVLLLNALASCFAFMLLGLDGALLFFSAGVTYIIVYEAVHAFCHSGIKTNITFIDALKDHHSKHHDLKLMSENNFSVVFPVLDTLFVSKDGGEDV